MYTPANFGLCNWAHGAHFFWNMDARSITKEVIGLITPTIESMGYELIEAEYQSEQGRWVLRLYIDQAEGITLKDCESVSRAVSALLDVEDVLPGRYSLEVSSPGIERPMRRIKDFEKYTGSVVKVRTTGKLGDRKNFTGVIEGVNGEDILLSENGEMIRISVGDIFKARLKEVDIGKGKGKSKG